MEGRPLTNEDFWQQLVARNCGRTDPLRHRNKLALLLAGATGLRESELTLITIGLFVSPTGELREFVELPDAITRDGFERPIVMSHPTLKEALEQTLPGCVNLASAVTQASIILASMRQRSCWSTTNASRSRCRTVARVACHRQQ